MSYLADSQEAPIGGNSSKLLRFSWALAGDVLVFAHPCFFLCILHKLFSPTASSSKERRLRSLEEWRLDVLFFFLPRLFACPSGVSTRKFPRLGFSADRFSLWCWAGLQLELGLVWKVVLLKFDLVIKEESLDAEFGDRKHVSEAQELLGVCAKSWTRLPRWPGELLVLFSGTALWLLVRTALALVFEFGVFAGVDGPLLRIWPVCSRRKLSRNGTKSFRSKFNEARVGSTWRSY